MYQINKKTIKGFTLVEMLVAIAVFMMVVTVAMSALMSIINANRKAKAIQSIVSNVNFVVESISRDIRMGSKYYCGTTQGVSDCSTGSGYPSVNYISPDGTMRVYYNFTPPVGSVRGYLRKCTDTLIGTNCSSILSNNPYYSQITSPDVNVLSVEFYVVRNGSVQPKVIIIMEGEAGSVKDVKSKFSLQTTASQRAMK